MAALLIFSDKCEYSMKVIEFISKHQQLSQIVQYHDVQTKGIPPAYASKITHVPTMLTTNGQMRVGNEIMEWLNSLLPNEFSACDTSSSFSPANLDDEEGDGGLFTLDSYGQSLQPAMTPDLEAKIQKSVSDAFNAPRN